MKITTILSIGVVVAILLALYATMEVGKPIKVSLGGYTADNFEIGGNLTIDGASILTGDLEFHAQSFLLLHSTIFMNHGVLLRIYQFHFLLL